MPALTFTADSGTDQLTSVGHGLLTGDGPAATRNISGALPAPLAAVTDYWIIRVSDDVVKLATSSANALAGTAINLTTNGTGTNILEVGIPYRRARTYVPKSVDVPGSQLKSADLNAMMDSLKALHAMLTGQAQSTWSHRSIVPIPASAFIKLSGAATFDDATGLWTGAGIFIAQVPLPPGTLIESVQWGYDRGGAGTVKFHTREMNVVTGVLESWQHVSNGAGTGYTTYTVTAADMIVTGAEPTIDANVGFSIAIEHSNAANVLGGIIVNASRG